MTDDLYILCKGGLQKLLIENGAKSAGFHVLSCDRSASKHEHCIKVWNRCRRQQYDAMSRYQVFKYRLTKDVCTIAKMSLCSDLILEIVESPKQNVSSSNIRFISVEKLRKTLWYRHKYLKRHARLAKLLEPYLLRWRDVLWKPHGALAVKGFNMCEEVLRKQ